MPTIELLAHISTDGRVTVPPIPDWPGGEANTPVYVRLPVTEKERKAAEDFMTSWDGCLKGVPHMTAKEIRAERLEKKYGNLREEDSDDWPTPTDEQLERMYTLCRGVLEGTTREEFDQLREERIMGR